MYKVTYIDNLDKLYVKSKSFDNVGNAMHFMAENVTKQNRILEVKYYENLEMKKENRT